MILFSNNSYSQFTKCNEEKSISRIKDLRQMNIESKQDTFVKAALYLSLARNHHCINSPIDTVLKYTYKSYESDPNSICNFIHAWKKDSTYYLEKGRKPIFLIENLHMYKFDYNSACETSKVKSTTDKDIIINASAPYSIIYQTDQYIRNEFLKSNKDSSLLKLMKGIDNINQQYLIQNILSPNDLNHLNKHDLMVVGLIILHSDNQFQKKAKHLINMLIEHDKLNYLEPIIDRFCCREIGYSYNGQYCEQDKIITKNILQKQFYRYFQKISVNNTNTHK